jgi:WD40 repeat protein/serine/threonine protein kinase
MNATTRCRTCGATLTADSPEGLCPKCLLAGGLAVLAQPPLTAPGEGPTQADIPATPFTGTRLRYFGDYELLEEIARGGMGVVFRARQVSLNRVVALKLISAGALATEELIKRFKAEAEAAASLSHPNIVPIYEIGEHQGQHYFSMGLIEGPNLREALATHNSPLITPKKAAHLVATVARAVHYAHQRGVLHRDIKPSNILLDEQGEPHLTDFGLAKLVEKESTLTRTYAVLGTPAYMAPEQARGEAKEVTTSADVYGLGAVLYEALTGSPPFGGGTSLETIRQVLEQEPRRPSILNSSVDRDLETVCLKCLEKDPSRRYSSAAAFANDLDRWLGHEPIRARPITNFERFRKWVRRRPGIAALTILLVVAVLGGLGVSIWQWRRTLLAQRQTETARDSLRRNLYVSDLGVAFASFQHGDVADATDLLELQRPKRGEQDLRGYEWRYLWGQARPEELSTFSPDSSTVWSLGFSPNGDFLALGAGNVRIWNYRERVEIATLPDSGGGPDDCVTFSPDGQLMASTHRFSREHGVKVWNVAAWQERYSLGEAELKSKFPVNGATFSPDNKLLAVVTGVTYGDGLPGEVKLLDAATSALLANLTGATSWLYRVRFSRDGRLLIATGGTGTVKLWDVQNRRELADLRGHRGTVFGLACSPDGKTLATGDSEGNIRLWDLSSRHEITSVAGHTGPVWVLAFSPDGKRFASGGLDKTVKLWDMETQRLIHTYRGHLGRVVSLEFSPDGSTLVSGSFDGTVKVWQPRPKPEAYVFRGHHARDAVCVSFSSDGRLFAMTTNRPIANPTTDRVDYFNAAADRVALFDSSTRTHKATLPGKSFVFAPVGSLLTTYLPTNRLQLWATDTMQMAGEIVTTSRIPEPAAMFFAFSPTAKRIAVGCEENRVEVWDVAARRRLQVLQVGTNGSAPGVLFWQGENHLITWTGNDGSVVVWEIEPQRRISTTRIESLEALAISPDQRRLAVAGRLVSLWDLPTLTPSRMTLSGNAGSIFSLAFSPDGKTLATGSNEGAIKLWNLTTGKEITTLHPHISYVRTLMFSPEPASRYLASGSIDDTITLWAAPGFDETDGFAAMSNGTKKTMKP